MTSKEYYSDPKSFAYNLGVIGISYQDGEIHLNLRGGEYVHSKIPPHLTSEEYLQVLLNKLHTREL
jgi:hypothetical protein